MFTYLSKSVFLFYKKSLKSTCFASPCTYLTFSESFFQYAKAAFQDIRPTLNLALFIVSYELKLNRSILTSLESLAFYEQKKNAKSKSSLSVLYSSFAIILLKYYTCDWVVDICAFLHSKIYRM